MPPRGARLRLQDVVLPGEKIARFIEGVSYEDFAESPVTIDAVVHSLAVIGEACRHVPPEIVALHPNIPWPLIVGIRNVFVHDYFRISTQVVWDAATTEVPPPHPPSG